MSKLSVNRLSIAFLEGGVGAVAAVLLRHDQRNRRIDEERRVEQHEPLDELGMAGGDLERQPAAERVPDPGCRLAAGGVDDQSDVLGDAPGWLVRRRAVTEQVGRDDAVVGKPALREPAIAAAVARDAVQADDTRTSRDRPTPPRGASGSRSARRACRATPAPSPCAARP